MGETLPPNSPLPSSDPKVDVTDAEALRFLSISRGETAEPPSLLLKTWRVTKRCLAAVLLLPIRIVFLFIFLMLILLIYRISICFGPSKNSALQSHSTAERFCLWIALPLWRGFLLCMGVSWIRVYKPEGYKAQNITVVGNHVTMLDGPLYQMAFGLVTGVAMAWTTKLPIAASVARAHHILAVERETPRPAATTKVSPELDPMEKPKSKTETIVEYQKLSGTDSRFLPLLIFPEATTHAAQCLVKFRTGAFVAGEPVQPVGVLWPEDLGWVHSVGGHAFDLMTRWWICVDFYILPPYTPNAEERKNPSLYSQNVQQRIAESMGLKPEQSSLKFGSLELIQLRKALEQVHKEQPKFVK